ncbi:hypothetical protein HRI_003993800 [Hibiscus trionum]|uniref:Uncharacterized protein n=1 Tax=Hibiscus trionum TaxID=183268 RepID=A0A9W7IVD3_HIBTR|nr:hypothetical protein HRI_003993800 [Hibiscus trionum]
MAAIASTLAGASSTHTNSVVEAFQIRALTSDLSSTADWSFLMMDRASPSTTAFLKPRSRARRTPYTTASASAAKLE